MGLKLSLKKQYRASLFNDSWIGFFLNPSFIVRSAIYRLLIKHSHLYNGKSVLDVGCGSKPYKDLFRASNQYIGVDTNQSGHDHKDEEIDVFYDGKSLPFPDESFDCVVSFQVLEHVENDVLFLQELIRVLKKEGTLIMTIPFVWPEHEQPYDFRRYTSFGVEKIFSQLGLQVKDLLPTTNFPQTILQLKASWGAQTLKTRSPVINILLSLSYVPLLNFLSFLLSGNKNFDLFSDLMVISKKP